MYITPIGASAFERPPSWPICSLKAQYAQIRGSPNEEIPTCGLTKLFEIEFPVFEIGAKSVPCSDVQLGQLRSFVRPC